MSPLEKYIPKKYKDSSDNFSEKGADSKLNKEKKEEIKRELSEFRKFQKERYSKRKQEIIAQAKETAAKKVISKEDFSDKENKVLNKKIRKERLSDYHEALKDEKDMPARDYAFAEITEYKLNKEIYNGEGGWKDEFLGTDAKEKMTLEEFVLQKQFQELGVIRETLMESRIAENITKLYKQLDGDEKIAEKSKKSLEVSDLSKKFFQTNAVSIEKYLSGEGDGNEKLKQHLLTQFKAEVFGDADMADAQIQALIEQLFTDFLYDYQTMLKTMDKVKILNPKIVSLLNTDGLTEEQWQEALAKEAEDQAAKLVELDKLKETDKEFSLGTPADIDVNDIYFGDISVTDKIGVNSNIKIQKIGPGEYQILFPSDSGTQQAKFSVKQVKENGKVTNLYKFEDPLMDKVAFTRDMAFRGQVNALYLDHVMGESIKHGKDYLGPDLNEIIHDQEMFSLGEKLFYPKKLSEIVLSKEQTEVFKKMMILLVNPANNEKGEGIYGNLLATRARVSLMELALGVDGGAKALSIYNDLKSSSFDSLKKTSVETFCKKIGVPNNFGNFSK